MNYIMIDPFTQNNVNNIPLNQQFTFSHTAYNNTRNWTFHKNSFKNYVRHLRSQGVQNIPHPLTRKPIHETTINRLFNGNVPNVVANRMNTNNNNSNNNNNFFNIIENANSLNQRQRNQIKTFVEQHIINNNNQTTNKNIHIFLLYLLIGSSMNHLQAKMLIRRLSPFLSTQQVNTFSNHVRFPINRRRFNINNLMTFGAQHPELDKIIQEYIIRDVFFRNLNSENSKQNQLFKILHIIRISSESSLTNMLPVVRRLRAFTNQQNDVNMHIHALNN